MLFSDVQITDLGDYFADLALKDDCGIYRERQVEDSSGGHSKSYALASTVKCALVTPSTPQELLLAQQRSQQTVKVILLPLAADVRGTDRLKHNGITYHIVGPYDPGSYEVLRRVSVVQAPLGETV